MHALYYHRHWSFGLYFEAKVAAGLAEFLQRFDRERDGFWLAMHGTAIVGSIAIDGLQAETEGAHLRWFILEPGLQGRGIGRSLLAVALEHCRRQRFSRVYLWTFAGLDAARHLYESAGFRLCRELEGRQWGVAVREQMFELILPPGS
jgi:GNAT superfamily N-acetyltransferase